MNALRSLARYLSLALPSFDVEIAPDESVGLSRPTVRVEAAAPVRSTPHGATHRDMRERFAAVAFPTEGMNAESSLLEAHRVRGLLLDAFTKGIDPAGFNGYSGLRRHPMRVPLFDYSGVGLLEAASDDERIGWARVVEPPQVQVRPDPDAASLYLVTADLVLGWSESVALAPGAPVDGFTVGAQP